MMAGTYIAIILMSNTQFEIHVFNQRMDMSQPIYSLLEDIVLISIVLLAEAEEAEDEGLLPLGTAHKSEPASDEKANLSEQNDDGDKRPEDAELGYAQLDERQKKLFELRLKMVSVMAIFNSFSN